MLKSVYAVVGFFVLMDVALAQAPTDQTKQDNFLANIIVVIKFLRSFVRQFGSTKKQCDEERPRLALI